MAGRILNRRELRKQADVAEQAGGGAPRGPPPRGPPRAEGKGEGPPPPPGREPRAPPGAPPAGAPPGRRGRAKAPAAPRARKPRAPKVPPRLRARWGVFDGGMRQVAIFDYNQRAAADAKLADLTARRKGTHFLQIV